MAGVPRRPFGATGVEVPVVGQGTWRMGEDRARRRQELAALRLGLDLGLTHIDTAEMYGDGAAERLVGEAIAGRREQVFLATKVLPWNASHAGTIRACEASLRRLRVERVDLYLLHWWTGAHPIAETMHAIAELVHRGLVRFAGVSNLDARQAGVARRALHPLPLACNQVLYSLRDREIERGLLPWCERRRIAVVGYTPFARGGFARGPAAAIARRLGCTPRQVALRYLTRRPSLFAIPKAGRPDHVRENAAAFDVPLAPADLRALGRRGQGPPRWPA
ncbi:MAG TPA: aldo/keto reductase [Candidatus Tectomicrobia bacterium]|nr:aldo/keto reductase [Candidatus Tectomicrobia bacterium]